MIQTQHLDSVRVRVEKIVKSLVIGSRGLVGSALFQLLQSSEDVFRDQTSIRWGSIVDAEKDLVLLVRKFFDYAAEDTWAIYWAAGKGHFGSTEDEMHVEEKLLDAVCTAVKSYGNPNGIFALMSSAGAIWANASLPYISERTPPNGSTPYARSKLRQESIVSQLSQSAQICGVNFRLSSVYGENQDLQKPQGLISRLCVASVMRKPVEIYVPLETTRNYIYSDDAAKMIVDAVRAISNSPESHGSAEVRVICSRDNHSIATVCKSVEVVTHRKLLITCKLTQKSERYPLHFQLTSDHTPQLSRYESTTLVAGISRVHHAMLRGFQRGRFVNQLH